MVPQVAVAPIAPAEFRERPRHAIGWPLVREGRDLVIRGRVEESEAVDTFSWRFGTHGRFERETRGALGQRVVSDGKTLWIRDGAGRTRALALGEIDTARLLAAVLSGDWLGDGFAAQADSNNVRLTLGRQSCTLALQDDRAHELTLRPSFGGETWSFEDYREFEGTRIATRIEQGLPAGIKVRYVVESVEWKPASAYAEPPATAARFDAAVSPELEVLKAEGGFLLVRPKIDGHEPGWFIFDTGAGTNVITAAAADSLGLASIGKSWLGMAGGAASGGIRQGRALQLGPLVIDEPLFVEMDLAQVSTFSGVEIVGIVGYDVLMRSVVEIEVDSSRIAVHDPARYQAPVAWSPITIYSNHAFVPGTFEGHEGLFRLDTGAPQVAVIFNGPAVEELRLLEGRETTKASIGVPGGTMDVAMGSVEGLEIAGHRFGKLGALFPMGLGGAFDDRYTLANLGQECMKPFRAVFDFGRQRAAFIER